MTANAVSLLESVTYVVTFKYDLGGEILDWSALMRRVGGAEAVREHFDLSVFNYSYVGSRDLPIRLRDETIVSEPQSACNLFHDLTSSNLVVNSAERQVWVYPRGVISIDYMLRFDKVEWEDFWQLALLVPREKNLDYTPYLKRELSSEMFSQIGHLVGDGPEVVSALFRNSEVLKSCQEALAGLVSLRSYRYAFHDFRQLAFLQPIDDSEKSALVPLAQKFATMGYPAACDSDVERTSTNGMMLMIGRWSCGGVLDGTVKDHAIKNTLVMYNHVHTSWFVCQAWIFALDDYIKELQRMDLSKTSQLTSLKAVRRNVDSWQAAIEYSLAEVFAVDLIVKDYSLTKLLTSLFLGLNLEQHYSVLTRRRQELDRFYAVVATAINERLEAERERQALILEAFFAAVTVFSIASVLLELSRGTAAVNLVVLGAILTIYCTYLVLRIRSIRGGG